MILGWGADIELELGDMDFKKAARNWLERNILRMEKLYDTKSTRIKGPTNSYAL